MLSADKDALEQGLEPSPLRWVETAVLTLGPVAVAAVFRPYDPYFVKSDFPWLALAPLLTGLRYGFAHGFASALALALGMGLGHRLGWSGLAELPGSRLVGTLVLGMLAGEFSDRWVRRLQRLRVVGRYRQQRLEEFSRAYHLLKVSHDRLEERMAGNTTSLRGALLTLRRRLNEGRVRSLRDVGDALMDLFAEHGWVQVAGLHEVNHRGEVLPEPVAELGAAGRIDPAQELLRRAIDTGALVTVRELSVSTGPLAAVPLQDVEGEMIGVVVIHEMPFVAFTEEHLHLLVVLGGHTADVLQSARTAGGEGDPAAQDFLRKLRRAHSDLRRYQLPCALTVVALLPGAVRLGVDRLIEGTKRGLDQDWRRFASGGRIYLFLLMPLTDAQGIEGYERRIHVMLQDRFAAALQPGDVLVRGQPLVKELDPVAQVEALGRACGFDQ